MRLFTQLRLRLGSSGERKAKRRPNTRFRPRLETLDLPQLPLAVTLQGSLGAGFSATAQLAGLLYAQVTDDDPAGNSSTSMSGGAIANHGSSLTISASTLSGNHAYSDGGGIATAGNSNAKIVVSGSTLAERQRR